MLEYELFPKEEEIFFVNVGGVKTRYLIKNTSKQRTLLLIPGWRTTIERIYPLVNFLSDFFNVITLDLPGMGKTQKLNVRHSPRNYGEFMAKFIKKLNLSDFNICGVSMGCQILLYALEYEFIKKNTNSIILLLPIYDKTSFRMNRVELRAIKILSRLLEKRPFSTIGEKVYSSELLMRFIVRLFEREKALKNPQNMKYHLTSFKNSSFKISMETLNELLSFQYAGDKRFNIDSFIVMSRNDPLINFSTTFKNYRVIFPRLRLIELSTNFHTPRIIVTKRKLYEMFGKEISEIISYLK